MAKKIDVPFNGTKEQEAKLRAALAELKESHGDNGLMIAALQKAQDIYGYLPEPVQQIIAEELGTSAAEVYGVSRAANARTTSNSRWMRRAASAAAASRP